MGKNLERGWRTRDTEQRQKKADDLKYQQEKEDIKYRRRVGLPVTADRYFYNHGLNN